VFRTIGRTHAANQGDAQDASASLRVPPTGCHEMWKVESCRKHKHRRCDAKVAPDGAVAERRRNPGLRAINCPSPGGSAEVAREFHCRAPIPNPASRVGDAFGQGTRFRRVVESRGAFSARIVAARLRRITAGIRRERTLCSWSRMSPRRFLPRMRSTKPCVAFSVPPGQCGRSAVCPIMLCSQPAAQRNAPGAAADWTFRLCVYRIEAMAGPPSRSLAAP